MPKLVKYSAIFIASFFVIFLASSVSAQENNSQTSVIILPSVNQPVPIPQPVINEPVPAVGQPFEGKMPLQNTDNQAPAQTCRVNGVEMPGTCDQYNNQSGGGGGEGDKSMDQNFQQDDSRRLKDMQREAKNIERELNPLLKTLTKAGVTMPDSVEKIKSALDTIKSATDGSTLADIDLGEIHGMVGELHQSVNDIQRLVDIKRNLKSMNQQLTSFGKQLAKLTKQKIAIPADITEKIDRIKTALTAINDSKTIEEVEAAGADDLQNMFQDLNDTRQQLEMLSRWPQVVKQMDKESANLDRQLKKSKTIVNRLVKKGIDLTTNYSTFEEGINQLKAVRDSAKEKMASGDGEGAFDLVENDFFGQMEEVYQNQRIIEMMNNLGQFNSQFKRDIATTEKQLKSMEKKKIDTSELRAIFDQVKTQGQVVIDLIKNKEVDPDEIEVQMSRLEELRVEFQNKMDEITGGSDNRVWEAMKTPQQFQTIKVNQQIKQVSKILHPSTVAGIKITK